MNVLFVPSIGLDPSLIDRLANSIDYPIKYKVALNNGLPGALNEFLSKHRDWIVKDSDVGNMGVAGSWNWVAKLFWTERAWLMINEDAWFLPGYLEEICRCSDNNQSDVPMVMMNETDPFYCFVWTAKGKDDFGMFDENFWPAYYEDSDMRIRHRIGAAHYAYALMGKPPVPHGKPKLGGVNYAAMIQGTGLFGRSYWLKKWGTHDHEKSSYSNPYRDSRLTIKDWVFDPVRRSKLEFIWDEFMSQSSPSIYT